MSADRNSCFQSVSAPNSHIEMSDREILLPSGNITQVPHIQSVFDPIAAYLRQRRLFCQTRRAKVDRPTGAKVTRVYSTQH
jgi:hypothetical protein